MKQITTKTTLSEKVGYGFAALGDAAAYGFISVFLLFFLTSVAGISPAMAGTIVAIGAFWNAVFNPIMGYISDRVYTKYGRRRPLILAFSLPLALSAFLLFTNVELADGVKPIYYGVMLMLYWTCYTGFFVPYLALGVDYTSDYDDRTVLRLFGSLFNMVGALFAMVAPSILVSLLETSGRTTDQAWSITGLFIGIISAISILVTFFTSKKKDPPCSRPVTLQKEPLTKALGGLFSEYFSVAKIGIIRYLLIANLCGLIVFTMMMSDVVYFFTNCKGLTSVEASSCLTLRVLLGLAFIPLTGKLIMVTDKRETMIGAYLLGSGLLLLVRFCNLPVVIDIPIYMVALSLCTAIYWQIMPGIFYDVCEYDRIKNGKNRSATIVSFLGLVEALAAGVGGQLLGWILDAAGFDGTLPPSAQSETALLWIENCGTLVPIGFAFIACFALYKYPLTKKVYNEMIEKAGSHS